MSVQPSQLLGRHGTQDWLTILGGAFAALAVVYLQVKGHTSLAFGAVLAVPLAMLVLARPWRGLALGIALIIVVPYTWVFGVAQASVPRLAVAAALGSLALGAAAGTRRVRFGPVDLAVLSFVAFGFVSWRLGAQPPKALREATTFLLPCAYFVVGRKAALARLESLLWTLLLAGTVAALPLYYEFFISHRPLFADPQTYSWLSQNGYIFRPSGALLNPPYAGAVLAMTSFAGFPLLRTTTGIRRTIVWASIAVSVVALVLTFTRAPMIGFAAGLTLYVLVLRPPHTGRIVFSAAIVVLVTALLVLPEVEQTGWYQKGILRQGTFATRQSFWSAAWPTITNSSTHFIIGHGINAQEIAQGQLQGPPDPDIANNAVLLDHSPHSQYLRTMIEEGVLGLALLIAWIGGAAFVGLLGALRSERHRAALAAGVASIASTLLVSFVDDALRSPPVMSVVSLVTGILVATSSREAEADESV